MSLTLTKPLPSLALFALGLALAPSAGAVSTVFVYQGQVQKNGAAESGTCDFRFALFDAASGGTQVGTTLQMPNLPVTGGLFAAPLDFGGGAFTGPDRWLDVQIRCPAGSGTFTVLTPRQALTAAPHALYSEQTPWTGVTGLSSRLRPFNLLSCSQGRSPNGTAHSGRAGWTMARRPAAPA